MPLQMAFGITVRDVCAVLAKNAGKFVCPAEISEVGLAAKLYHSFTEEEMDDIALAAMDAFLDDRPEMEGAHRVIRKLLIKKGVLDVSRRVPAKQGSSNGNRIDFACAVTHS